MSFPSAVEIARISTTSSTISTGEAFLLKVSPVSRALCISPYVVASSCIKASFNCLMDHFCNFAQCNFIQWCSSDDRTSAYNTTSTWIVSLSYQFIIRTKSCINDPITSSILSTYYLDPLSLDTTSQSVIVHLP